MDNVNINIPIEESTLSIMKKIKGKTLKKIGFSFYMHYSPLVALIFDDITVKVSSEIIVVRQGDFVDEFVSIEMDETVIEDDIAYVVNGKETKYEYKEYEMVIDDVEIYHDHVAWVDELRDMDFVMDIENIIVLRSAEKQLVIFVQDMGSQAVELYESDDVLNGRLDIKWIWPVENQKDEPIEPVEYVRSVKRIE